ELHLPYYSGLISAITAIYLKSFIYASGTNQHVHSFPTRRSSDLMGAIRESGDCEARAGGAESPGGPIQCQRPDRHRVKRSVLRRSEEHTSELQSRFDLVCRLLLEKKKQKSHSRGTIIRPDPARCV